MPNAASVQSPAAARDEFLASGAVSPGIVGDGILSSWHRSRRAGVDVTAPDVPFEEADPRSRLADRASPVLDRLQDRLDGIPVTIALTGPDGRILERRERDASLARALDRVYFAPGFSYAEAHVGTNGVGTPIEDGRAVFVRGSEHFTERSIRFACAGAPIRDPLTGRIEGLVNVSSLEADGHPMMRILAEEASHGIERLLLEDGGHQQAVLDTFHALCRRRRGSAVLSVYDDVVIANRVAFDLLSPADEEMLRQTATDVRADTSESELEMSLSDGRRAQVRCHPIPTGSRPVAATVFEIRLPAQRRTRDTPRQRIPASPVPGLAGRAPVWLEACSRAYVGAERRESVLIDGEPGSGKLSLARAVCRAARPDNPTTVVDPAQEELTGIVARLAGLAPATSVILRRLDELDEESQTVLAETLDDLAHRRGDCWIVGTARTTGTLSTRLAGRFTTSVTVPPLRHRGDDLPELVSLFLRRIAPERAVECAPDALSVLARNPWTGNLTELRSVLREALARRPVGAIRAEDLPTRCFTTSRRRLTPLEVLERDAIVAGLRNCGGNRKVAAAQLQMSRSSLYRKIHAYGITEA